MPMTIPFNSARLRFSRQRLVVCHCLVGGSRIRQNSVRLEFSGSLATPATAPTQILGCDQPLSLSMMKAVPAGKIFVAGHRGMVGSAVCRRLADAPCQLVTATRSELDLCNVAATTDFLATHQPDIVIFAAARVGGIVANNTYPVQFLSDNVLMAVGAINAAYQTGVKRFLFLGSTCIYPRDCQQPIREQALLTGPLEKTNEAYALAKITGLKLCEYYRRQYGVLFHSAMPTNLYGPGDNYHPEHSHVLPALIRRFHEAKLAARTDGHDLGLRNAPPRIPVRRRFGRCDRPSDWRGRSAGLGQRRHRCRPNDLGIGSFGGRNGRLSRTHRDRSRASRRYAHQVHRRDAAAWIGLEAPS